MASGDHRLWACVCTWSTWWGPGQGCLALCGHPTSALSAPCAAHAGNAPVRSTSQPFPLLVFSLSLSLCAHPLVHCNKIKQCALEPSPSVVKSLSESTWLGHRPLPLPPPLPVWPILTGLHRSPSVLPPSPRCGDHLQERIRSLLFCLKGGLQITTGRRQMGVLQ